MIETLVGSGNDLTVDRMNSAINRSYGSCSNTHRAFIYRCDTPMLFFAIDLFIGFPLAIYWEKKLSFNSMRFITDKPRVYRHPFEKFRKVK